LMFKFQYLGACRKHTFKLFPNFILHLLSSAVARVISNHSQCFHGTGSQFIVTGTGTGSDLVPGFPRVLFGKSFPNVIHL
jgi:hypothetical protein